jgi:hypothetical protein
MIDGAANAETGATNSLRILDLPALPRAGGDCLDAVVADGGGRGQGIRDVGLRRRTVFAGMELLEPATASEAKAVAR